LRKNFDHDVEGRLRIIPNVHVGPNESYLHTALGSQRACFVLRRWRKIERNDVEGLFGEPHAVAALAVRDRERPAARRQYFLAGFEKVIRLFAECIIGRREPRLPARISIHPFVS